LQPASRVDRNSFPARTHNEAMLVNPDFLRVIFVGKNIKLFHL
jgi:hypothetical protein